jgi:ribose transport system permease protein
MTKVGLKELLRRPALGALACAALLHVAGVFAIEGYGGAFALRAMLVLAALLAVASVGQTLVVIVGGIDLSIPYVIGFANVVAAQLYGEGMSFVLVCLIVSVLALAIGAFNGALSSTLGVHPLIVTLGVGAMAQGAVLIWTHGFPSGSAPAYVSDFVSIGGAMGPIPAPGLIPATAVLACVVALLLSRTAYGRRLYALGGSPLAARYALISATSMWTITFALSAWFAALAGVLLLGFTGSAYGDVGQPYLFQTLAAVVIGGTSLLGGRGSYWGTVVGAVVLTELNTLLIGLGLQPSLVQAALGAVIILLLSLYGREPHISTTI